jgi:hypothetical protein
MVAFVGGADSGEDSELVRAALGEEGESGAENEVDREGAECLVELRAAVGSLGPTGCHPAAIAGVRAPRGGHRLCAVGKARAPRGRRRQAGWTGRAGFAERAEREGRPKKKRKMFFFLFFKPKVN